jgi:hypothetical protein
VLNRGLDHRPTSDSPDPRGGDQVIGPFATSLTCSAITTVAVRFAASTRPLSEPRAEPITEWGRARSFDVTRYVAHSPKGEASPSTLVVGPGSTLPR